MRDPSQQQAVGDRKRNQLIKHPLLIPRSWRARPKGGWWPASAHLSLPVAASSWSACHLSSWRGRKTHHETDQLLPHDLSCYLLISLYFILQCDNLQSAPCRAWRDALAHPQIPSATRTLPCLLLTLHRPQQLAPDSSQALKLSWAHISMSE